MVGFLFYLFSLFLTSSKVILSRGLRHCFLHTLNLKKGSPRLFCLLTLLTALQRRNRLLKLFSFYPRHPKPIAIRYSPGTSFLRNINTTFPTGRKECSSPPKGRLLLPHPPRQAKKQNTIGAWSAKTHCRGEEPARSTFFRGHSQAVLSSLKTPRLTLDKSYVTGVGISQEVRELWPTRATCHPHHPRPCVDVLKLNSSIYSGSLLKPWCAGGKGVSYHEQR